MSATSESLGVGPLARALGRVGERGGGDEMAARVRGDPFAGVFAVEGVEIDLHRALARHAAITVAGARDKAGVFGLGPGRPREFRSGILERRAFFGHHLFVNAGGGSENRRTRRKRARNHQRDDDALDRQTRHALNLLTHDTAGCGTTNSIAAQPKDAAIGVPVLYPAQRSEIGLKGCPSPR